ncbi:MAG: bifunctional diaminohydroxyphosphoribosylaminopyrimidine deaminase/5-amino-6-(5-phosphoribosylamino)uracil reductase RibD [Candidatus Omnitrophota bacterium]
MKSQIYFMKRAIELAKKGMFTTSPNPMVGAIVVKNEKVISESYHKRAGSLHAEAMAIKKAGKRAKGATLYVTLEPCSHIGRTPPCVDSIIKSGISKVICAMKDPNPLNNGKGIEILRRNKIKVSVGLLEKEAKELNHIFIKYITEKLPFVILKLAESLDGKIATRKYDSKWITSESSREYAHKLRSEADAVLVGVNTIIKDDPFLTSRSARSPIKVILDPTLRIPDRSKIFSKASPSLNIIAVLKKTLMDKKNLEKIVRLNKKGVMLIACQGRKGKIDLKRFLHELAELEVSTLLVEGGGETIAGFLEQGLVDKALFFIAPKIIGGKNAIGSVGGIGIEKIKDAIELKGIKVDIIDKDILVSGYVYRNN